MFFFSNCHTCCHYLVHHLARIHRTLIVGRSTRFVSAICRGFDFSTLRKINKKKKKKKKKTHKTTINRVNINSVEKSSRRTDSLLLQAGFNEMKSIMLATIFHEKMKMKNYLIRRLNDREKWKKKKKKRKSLCSFK